MSDLEQQEKNEGGLGAPIKALIALVFVVGIPLLAFVFADNIVGALGLTKEYAEVTGDAKAWAVSHGILDAPAATTTPSGTGGTSTNTGASSTSSAAAAAGHDGDPTKTSQGQASPGLKQKASDLMTKRNIVLAVCAVLAVLLIAGLAVGYFMLKQKWASEALAAEAAMAPVHEEPKSPQTPLEFLAANKTAAISIAGGGFALLVIVGIGLIVKYRTSFDWIFGVDRDGYEKVS